MKLKMKISQMQLTVKSKLIPLVGCCSVSRFDLLGFNDAYFFCVGLNGLDR